MNIKEILKEIFLPIMFLTLISCGAEIIDDSVISGTISMPDDCIEYNRGPLFVAVSKTDDIELIENDPAAHIAAIFEADLSKGRFSFNLNGTGIGPGDEVSLFAFADNDYRGGVPSPTAGDIVGVYVDRSSLSTKYRIGSTSYPAPPPDIILNRIYYEHNAVVEGIIDSEEAGDVILIAYVGDLSSIENEDGWDSSSTDFSGMFSALDSAIDIDKIIGYKKISKPANPVEFSLRIMPAIHKDIVVMHKNEMGIENVYIFAVLDLNRNGKPDKGDKIGSPYWETVSVYGIPIELPAPLPEPLGDGTTVLDKDIEFLSYE